MAASVPTSSPRATTCWWLRRNRWCGGSWRRPAVVRSAHRAEFRVARQAMPLARDDSIFAYFSDPFFRNLTGPRYRIETMRRLEAVADIELVELARLLATAEGRRWRHDRGAACGMASAAGLRSAARRQPRRVGRGRGLRQSSRARGALVPVPDVPVERITVAEEAAYAKFAEFFAAKWGRVDPLAIGVRRQSLPQHCERVALDADDPLCRPAHRVPGAMGRPARQTATGVAGRRHRGRRVRDRIASGSSPGCATCCRRSRSTTGASLP